MYTHVSICNVRVKSASKKKNSDEILFSKKEKKSVLGVIQEQSHQVTPLIHGVQTREARDCIKIFKMYKDYRSIFTVKLQHPHDLNGVNPLTPSSTSTTIRNTKCTSS